MNIVEFGQVGFHQLKIPLFRFWSSHSVPLFAASILDMWRFNPLFSQSRVAFLLVEYMFAGWFPHVCLWNPQFCWWNLSLFLLVNIPVLFAKTWVCLRGPPKEKQVFSTDATNGKLILAKCTQQTCSANSRKSIMFLLTLPFGGKYTHSQTPKIPYHWVIYIYITSNILIFPVKPSLLMVKPPSFNIVFHHVFNLFVTKISSFQYGNIAPGSCRSSQQPLALPSAAKQ